MIKTKLKSDIELSVEKKQEVEKFIFKGHLKPKPGQRVFRLDTNKMIVDECLFEELSDTINYMDVVSGKYLRKDRAIIIQEGYDYVIKLNLQNALKYFKNKWDNQEITSDSIPSNRLFKRQGKVKLFENK